MGGIGHGGNKHKAELSPVMPSASDITEDGLLNGRIRLRQPARGYRAGMDAALLAATCDAGPGERVGEAGRRRRALGRNVAASSGRGERHGRLRAVPGVGQRDRIARLDAGQRSGQRLAAVEPGFGVADRDRREPVTGP
jgi:hypothetical protein